MSKHETNELWEKSLRGRLTPGERAQFEAWLARHPDSRAEWEEEAALCQALRQLPDAPVSSNFTAQVMQIVALEEGRAHRVEESDGFMGWLRRHLVQLTASTAVVTIAAVLAIHQQRQMVTQRKLAEEMKMLATVSPVPSVDVLKDYEAIRRLSQMPAEPDLELLAALQ